jgi:hypothetical protein
VWSAVLIAVDLADLLLLSREECGEMLELGNELTDGLGSFWSSSGENDPVPEPPFPPRLVDPFDRSGISIVNVEHNPK